MPYICPVCSKQYHASQNCLQCDTCKGWVHHGNRLKCSGLTDVEFAEHQSDEHKPFECDHCVALKIAAENGTYFMQLPFPVECEGNIFGKPEPKPSPDITSMTPAQLKKFVKQCETINEQINSANDGNDNDDDFTGFVNSKYYNIKNFNSQARKVDKDSSLSLMHVNIASLNAHIDDLRTVLARLKCSFDIIGITEHKIQKESTPSNNFDLTGYEEFKFEPTGTTHGGAGFYIKNSLDYKVRDDLKLNSPGDYEAMFIEIILSKRKNMIVGCVYRHGSSKILLNDFTSKYLEPIFCKISKEKKDFALMGDFNVDLLKSTGNNAVAQFYNNLSSYFFTPFILQPTRLSSKTLIDNIFMNSLDYNSYSGNLLYELSDHLIQFLILEGFVKERSLPQTKIFKRDLSNLNVAEFEEIVINGLDWNEICMFHIGNSSASFKSFFDTVKFHIDEMSPEREVHQKEFRLMLKPWISKDLLEKCDKRDDILKELKGESDPLKSAALKL